MTICMHMFDRMYHCLHYEDAISCIIVYVNIVIVCVVHNFMYTFYSNLDDYLTTDHSFKQPFVF